MDSTFQVPPSDRLDRDRGIATASYEADLMGVIRCAGWLSLIGSVLIALSLVGLGVIVVALEVASGIAILIATYVIAAVVAAEDNKS